MPGVSLLKPEKKIGATNEIKEVIMMALSPKKLLLNPSNG
jgi:hypothetical protein